MTGGGDRRSFMALALGLSAAPAAALAEEAADGELFVFLYRAGPAWKPGVPMQQQALRPHVVYMQSLMDAGKLFAGGRFMTSDGGLAIVTAKDLDAARAMLAADPAVTGGVFVGEAQHWVPRFRTNTAMPGKAAPA